MTKKDKKPTPTVAKLARKIMDIQAKSTLPVLIMLGNEDGNYLFAGGGKNSDIIKMLTRMLDDPDYTRLLKEAALMSLKKSL
jgi:1,4-dihydroxy-2-naphthoyl-CoA synthase